MAGLPPIPNPNVPLPKGFHPGSPGTSQPVYNNNAMWNLPSNPEDKYSSGQPVWANQGTPHQPGYQILEDGGYYPPPGQGTQPVQMQQFTGSSRTNDIGNGGYPLYTDTAMAAPPQHVQRNTIQFGEYNPYYQHPGVRQGMGQEENPFFYYPPQG